MSIELIPGFGAFTPVSSLLDGSESDGTNLFVGGSGMTSGWAAVNATLNNAAATAPDGATTASSLIESASGGRHILYQQVLSFTADATFRFSVYAKATGRRYLQIMASPDSGTAGNVWAYFDLQIGASTDSGKNGGAQTVSNVSVANGANAFYKCSVDMRFSATSTSAYFVLALSDVATYGAPVDSDNPTYSGDGTSGAYVWRPKLVAV